MKINFLNFFAHWLGGSSAIRNTSGMQQDYPDTPVMQNLRPMDMDLALQVGAIYACVEILANTVASLPLFVFYDNKNGKNPAYGTDLWFLLHDSPNRSMTSFEFWRAMMMYLELRGNAYARIDRKDNGDAYSLVPLNTDQVTVFQDDTGKIFYKYTKDAKDTIYNADDILHLRGLGNGIMGLSKLDYMRTSATEAIHAQETANNLFGNANKPSGILTVNHILNKDQRAAIKDSFASMREGKASGLFVLEDDMKYTALSLTPAETQLLETRKYSVAEIARWFGVPPVLISGDATTTWGSGIEQIIEGFYRFTIRPLLVSIEQSIRKQVFSSIQRQKYAAEFDLDELLRTSETSRYEIYSKAVQNGLMTRNEARKRENLDPITGGDDITVQSNLININDLGKIAPTQTPSAEQPTSQEPIKQ